MEDLVIKENNFLYDKKTNRIINLSRFYTFDILQIDSDVFCIEGYCAPTYTHYSVDEKSTANAVLIPDAVNIATFTTRQDAIEFMYQLFAQIK